MIILEELYELYCVLQKHKEYREIEERQIAKIKKQQ